MSTLPQGWTSRSLESVVSDISYGYTAKSNAISGDARMLRITDIQEGRVKWDSVPYCAISDGERARYSLREGDLVVARTGATVGKSFLIRHVPPHVVFASYLIRIRPANSSLATYISHFFNSYDYWQQITDFSAGIGQPNVNGSKLRTLVLPIAPALEQQRIADKLDTVLARVDACRDRLARVAPLLKRFRQSILSAATSGRLTADWHAHNGSQDRPRDSTFCIDEKNADVEQWLTSLPSSWRVLRAAEVVEPQADIVYGIVQPGEKLTVGVPYVQSMDIVGGRIMLDQLQRTSPTIAAKYARSTIKGGDVLLGIIRATKVAVVPQSLVSANIARSVARLRPSKLVLSRYLAIALEAPNSQRWLQAQHRGMDMPVLNLADVRQSPVPLPCTEEQTEIVRRVETLFAYADRLEARLAAARTATDRLTPALLAKAFRGELVPQDPADEPASELLKRLRIQSEQAQATTATARAGKPRKAIA